MNTRFCSWTWNDVCYYGKIASKTQWKKVGKKEVFWKIFWCEYEILWLKLKYWLLRQNCVEKCLPWLWKQTKKKFKIKLDLSRKNHINDSSAEGWAFWCFFFRVKSSFLRFLNSIPTNNFIAEDLWFSVHFQDSERSVHPDVAPSENHCRLLTNLLLSVFGLM